MMNPELDSGDVKPAKTSGRFSGKVNAVMKYGNLITFSLPDEFNLGGFVSSPGFVMSKVQFLNEEALQQFGDSSASVFRVIPAHPRASMKRFRDKLLPKEQLMQRVLNEEEIKELQGIITTEVRPTEEDLQKWSEEVVEYGSLIQLQHLNSYKFLAFRPETTTKTHELLYKVFLDEFPTEYSCFKFMSPFKHLMDQDRSIRFGQQVYLISAVEKFNRDAFVFIDRDSRPSNNNIPFLEKEPIDVFAKGYLGDGQDQAISSDIFVSFAKKTRFQLNYYDEFDANRGSKLAVGDVVWINHVEKSTALVIANEGMKQTGTEAEKTTTGKNIVCFDTSTEENSRPVRGMWKLESEHNSGGVLTYEMKVRFNHLNTKTYLAVKPSGDLYTLVLDTKPSDDTLFEICHVDSVENNAYLGVDLREPILYDHLIRLRHMKTRLWLSLTNETVIQVGKIEGAIDDIEEKGSKTVEKPELKSKSNTEPDHLRPLTFTPIVVKQDVYRFNQAFGNETWEIKFLNSAISFLDTFPTRLEAIKAEYKQNGMIRVDPEEKAQLDSLRLVLISIIHFCFTEIDDEYLSYCLTEIIPNAGRQLMLKENGLLTRMTTMINQILPDMSLLDKVKNWGEQLGSDTKVGGVGAGADGGQRQSVWQVLKGQRLGEDYFLDKRNETQLILLLKEILKLCFLVIKSMAYGNKTIQNEAAKHFTTLVKFVGHGVGATETIMAILENNERLLLILSTFSIKDMKKLNRDNFMPRQATRKLTTLDSVEEDVEQDQALNLVDLYLKYLKNEGKGDRSLKIELLEFLSKICLNEDSGITINQLVIHRDLAEYIETINKPAPNPVFIPMVFNEAGNLTLCFYTQDEFRLDTSHKQVQIPNKYLKEINYVTNQIRFLGNLGTGRNYVSINSIKKIAPLASLLKNIWNDNLINNSIRAGLVNLLYVAYVDTSPNYEINLPNRVALMQNEETIFQEIRSHSLDQTVDRGEVITPDGYQKLKSDIINYLANFLSKVQGTLDTENPEGVFNEFLIRIIDLTKGLCKFGIIAQETLMMEFDPATPSQRNFTFLLNKLLALHIIEPPKSVNQGEERPELGVSRNSDMGRNSSVGNLPPAGVKLKTEDTNLIDPMFGNNKSQSHAADVQKSILQIFMYLLEILNEQYRDGLYRYLKDRVNTVGAINNPSEQDAQLIKEVEKQKLYPPLLSSSPDNTGIYPRSLVSTTRNLKQLILPTVLNLFTQTKNYELQGIALTFILKLFQQRRNLIDSIQKTLPVFDVEENLIYQYMKAKSIELSYACEQSEFWLGNASESTDRAESQQYLTLVTTSLHNLTCALFDSTRYDRNSKELMILPPVDDIIQRGLNQGRDQAAAERGAAASLSPLPCKIRQFMAANLGIHNVILTLLKDGSFLLPTLSTDGNAEIKRLFESCYQFLYHFVYDFSSNRKKVYKERSFLLLQLNQTPVPLGQTAVLNEIFRDFISQNNNEASLLDNIRELIQRHGRSQDYLSLFEILVQKDSNGLSSPDTRQAIFNIFLKNQAHLGRLLYLRPVSPSSSNLFREFDFMATKVLDQPYIYHARILSLLISCVGQDDGRGIPRYVLQRTFAIDYITNLLLNPDIYLFRAAQSFDPVNALKNTIYQQTLLDFFNKVWLESERPSTLLMNNENITKFINNEIAKLTSLTTSDIEAMQNGKLTTIEQFANVHEDIRSEMSQNDIPGIVNGRYCYFKYLFQSVIPVMSNLVQILTSDVTGTLSTEREDLKSLQNFSLALLKSAPSLLVPLFEMNPKLQELFDSFLQYQDLSTVPLDKCLENLKNLSSTLIFYPQNEGNAVPADGSTEDNYLTQLRRPYIYATTAAKDKSEAKRIWSSFFINFGANEKACGYIEDEMQELLNILKGNRSESFLGTAFKVEKFLAVLVEFLQQKLKEMSRDYDKLFQLGLIFFLKLLKKSSDTKEKKKLQCYLAEIHLPAIILDVFCTEKLHHKHFKASVLLAIEILDGGNENVQKSFYEYFVSHENTEVFFRRLKIIFEDEHMCQPSSRTSAFSDKSAGDKLHKLHALARKYKGLEINILDILRLLQLFTEGHFSDMQHLMRYQRNSRISINIIDLIIKLCERLIGVLTEWNYKVLIQAFDTLTEFVQGPCLENQKSIADSKFIEIVYQLLTKYPQEQKKEGFLKFLERAIEKNNKQKRPLDKDGNTLEDKIVASKLTIQTMIETKSHFLALGKISPSLSLVLEDLYREHFSESFASWMISRMKYKCLITTESLLEGFTDKYVLKKLVKGLPSNILKQNLLWIYNFYQTLYDNMYTRAIFDHADIKIVKSKLASSEYRKRVEFIIEIGFQVFILMNHFTELGDDEMEDLEVDIGLVHFRKELKEAVTLSRQDSNLPNLKVFGRNDSDSKKVFKEALMFFSKHTASIEVLRGESLVRTYFPIPPHCLYLNTKMKDSFMENVNRTSAKTKVTKLCEESNDLIETMKHDENLTNVFIRIPLLGFIAKHVQLWKDISFIICIIQNILILDSFQHKPNETDRNTPKISRIFGGNTKIVSTLLTILSMIQVVLSIICFVFFVLKTAPLHINKAFQDKSKEESNTETKSGGCLGCLSGCFRFIWRVLVSTYYTATDFMILYYFIYTIFAFLGLLGHFIFVSFLLYDVVLRSSLLRYIVLSLWRSRWPFVLTIILFLIFQYQFTIISYVFFNEEYGFFCDSLLTCFITNIDQTFKQDGGAGGFLDSISSAIEEATGAGKTVTASRLLQQTSTEPTSREIRPSRLLFDNIFFFLAGIIIVQVITGIIIDTFATLREEEEKKDDDLQNYCFICGNGRESFEQSSSASRGFVHHTKNEHNVWNYLFFISYLQSKAKTEYTGIESYVAETIEKSDVSWFPINKAIALMDAKQESQFDPLKYMDNVDHTMDVMEQKMKNLEDKVFALIKS